MDLSVCYVGATPSILTVSNSLIGVSLPMDYAEESGIPDSNRLHPTWKDGVLPLN